LQTSFFVLGRLAQAIGGENLQFALIMRWRHFLCDLVRPYFPPAARISPPLHQLQSQHQRSSHASAHQSNKEARSPRPCRYVIIITSSAPPLSGFPRLRSGLGAFAQGSGMQRVPPTCPCVHVAFPLASVACLLLVVSTSCCALSGLHPGPNMGHHYLSCIPRISI
jgi:hypothetical protein